MIKCVEFLTELFDIGNSNCYSAVNTARSALSMIMLNGISIGNSPIDKIFMNSVYELRPPVVLSFLWNVNVVLEYLKSFYPRKDLDLSYLAYKLAVVLGFASKQCVQHLHIFDCSNIKIFDHIVINPIRKLAKNTNRKTPHLRCT